MTLIEKRIISLVAQRTKALQDFEASQQNSLDDNQRTSTQFINRYPNYYAAQNPVLLAFLRSLQEIQIFEIERQRTCYDSRMVKIEEEQQHLELHIRATEENLAPNEVEQQMALISHNSQVQLQKISDRADTAQEILTSLRDKEMSALRWLIPVDAKTVADAESDCIMTKKSISHVQISEFPSERATRIFKSMKNNNYSFLTAYSLNADDVHGFIHSADATGLPNVLLPIVLGYLSDTLGLNDATTTSLIMNERDQVTRDRIRPIGEKVAQAAAEQVQKKAADKAIEAAAVERAAAELLSAKLIATELEVAVQADTALEAARAPIRTIGRIAAQEAASKAYSFIATSNEINKLQQQAINAANEWKTINERPQASVTAYKIAVGAASLGASFGVFGLAHTLGATAAISILAAVPIAGWTILIGAAVLTCIVAIYKWYLNTKNNSDQQQKESLVGKQVEELKSQIEHKQTERFRLFAPNSKSNSATDVNVELSDVIYS